MPDAEVLAALPIFPLPNTVLLPGMVLPLNVFEPRYLELVDHVDAQGQGHIGVPLLRPGFESDYDGRPEIEPVFGIGRMVAHQRLPNGRRFIRLEGLGRVRLRHELPARASFREVAVQPLVEDEPEDDHQLAILRAQLERICSTLDAEDERLVCSVLQMPDARLMTYALTAILPTLGYGTFGDEYVQGRPTLLELQQRCLSADTADERVSTLLTCFCGICDDLGDSGRFPRHVWN
jgi:Lon protease-like protein